MVTLTMKCKCRIKNIFVFTRFVRMKVFKQISNHFIFIRQSASTSYLTSSQQALRKEETFDINDLSVSDYDVGKNQTRRLEMNMRFVKFVQ